MTINEAIKINKSLLDGTYDHRDESMEAALKLGIEALKRFKTWRFVKSHLASELLPGETKD